MSFCRIAALLLPLALAVNACGELPQPFRNRPGAQAQRLAMPMALRLAVPPPTGALLADAPARKLATQVAAALQAQELPAIATDTPLPLDWRVEIVAERQGEMVLPRFRLLDADSRPQATSDGAPVPLRDWSDPTPETLAAVAAGAAPALQNLLLQVEAARKATDPASLAAGPPRMRLAGVRGAPGDGNTALAARMREQLGVQGFVVQDSAEGAGYALQADVVVSPQARGVQRVEIQWIVSRRDGEELGRVAQLNEVPPGRLNRFWGDIAYAAAEEAADGVRTVVANAMGAPPTTSGAPSGLPGATPPISGAPGGAPNAPPVSGPPGAARPSPSGSPNAAPPVSNAPGGPRAATPAALGRPGAASATADGPIGFLDIAPDLAPSPSGATRTSPGTAPTAAGGSPAASPRAAPVGRANAGAPQPDALSVAPSSAPAGASVR